jgi:hypothetical protein
MTKLDPERPESEPDRASSSKGQRTRNLRKQAVAEGKQFVILFVYLWVLFGLFVLNERIVLHQRGIDFVSHGFAVFNAFILAKVMLIAEHLDFTRWLDRRPLIYPILYDSFCFAILFIAFHVVEEMIVNVVGGEAVSASIPNIGGGGIAGIICVAVILFFALIPFFAFRNFNRVLGPDRLHSMLFIVEPEAFDRTKVD